MPTANLTLSSVSEFVLICFAGVESWQHWLSIPLGLLFLVALTANTTLLVTIYSAQSLHSPMYYFLFHLALVDLILSLSIAPKALSILLFRMKSISLIGCFSQMFFIYFCQAMELSVFVVLAYDRYVAICNPLRYSSIITEKMAAQTVALVFTHTTVISLPYPFLVARLDYCVSNTVSHCFCENTALSEIACNDTLPNNAYSLSVISFFLITHVVFLVFSYTMIIRAVLKLGTWEASVKAFSTCTTQLIGITCIFSIMVITVISNRAGKFIPRYTHVLIAVLRYLAPTALNPMAFSIRTKEVNQAIRMLIGNSIAMCI